MMSEKNLSSVYAPLLASNDNDREGFFTHKAEIKFRIQSFLRSMHLMIDL